MSKMVRRLIGAMLLGIAVYGAFVLYSGVDLIAHSFGDFAWWTFGAACALAFSNYLIRFLKWEYYLGVLGIRGVPKGESLLIFLSGFVLTVTPGKVGEVFKSLILKEIHDVPVERTAPIVIAERVTDLIGVITLIALGSLSLPGGLVWASVGAGLVAALLVFISSATLSARFLNTLPRLPGALGRGGAKIESRVSIALHGLRDLTTPRRLIWPTLLSIAAWSFEGIALWVILGGFNQHPPLTTTAFIYATATLAGALVPMPGGLGVTDGLLKGQMASLAHVAAPTATAAMLLVRFATLWFAVAVGFVALALLRARNPSLAANGDGSEAPAGAGIEKTP